MVKLFEKIISFLGSISKDILILASMLIIVGILFISAGFFKIEGTQIITRDCTFLFPFIVGAVLLVVGFILFIISYPTKKYPQQSLQDTIIEVIDTREEIYRRASRIISRSKWVLDTTWGSDPPLPSKQTEVTLNEYLLARREAVKAGIKYKELFTETEGRAIRLNESIKESKLYPNYEIRILEGRDWEVTVLDFLIGDGKELILSHVHAHGANEDRRYIYVNSPALAGVFCSLFDECWRIARKPEQLGVRQ